MWGHWLAANDLQARSYAIASIGQVEPVIGTKRTSSASAAGSLLRRVAVLGITRLPQTFRRKEEQKSPRAAHRGVALVAAANAALHHANGNNETSSRIPFEHPAVSNTHKSDVLGLEGQRGARVDDLHRPDQTMLRWPGG